MNLTAQLQQYIAIAKNAGALRAAPVMTRDIAFFPELRRLCEQNACGQYDTNWSCPPHCGSVETLSGEIRSHAHGIVYQYTGGLEDSFDYPGMQAHARAFAQIGSKMQDLLMQHNTNFRIYGAGTCALCPACAFPGKPCRHPDHKIISVEACGIDVSKLCTLVGLQYNDGENSVTYTGLIAL